MHEIAAAAAVPNSEPKRERKREREREAMKEKKMELIKYLQTVPHSMEMTVCG